MELLNEQLSELQENYNSNLCALNELKAAQLHHEHEIESKRAKINDLQQNVHCCCSVLFFKLLIILTNIE